MMLFQYEAHAKPSFDQTRTWIVALVRSLGTFFLAPSETPGFMRDLNGGASRARTDDLIVANDAPFQFITFACLRLAVDHVPKRSNSGLPGELPQQFFRLESHRCGLGHLARNMRVLVGTSSRSLWGGPLR